MKSNWEIVRPLGHGLSGSVFEVREVGGLHRRGAMKIHRGGSVRASERDFGREADWIEAQPVPGFMPAFYDRGTFEGRPCYVMELAEELPGKLPRRRLVRVIDRIADALDRLDAQGILHGDVKPTNLALVRGKAVLLDFGSARRCRDQADDPACIGTPFYRAPEIVRGEPASRLTDIYSLGVTLGELCRDRDARVFAPLARRATTTDPAARPQSFADFRRELLAAEADFRRAARAETRYAKFATVVKRAALVLAAVLIAYGCIIYAVRRHRQKLLYEDNRDLIRERAFRKADSIP